MLKIRRVRRSEFFTPMTPGWILGSSLFVVAVLSLYWVNSIQTTRLTACPMRLLAGIPCPLCGGTTASFMLAAGEFATAFKKNPLVTVSLIAYAGWSILWLGFGLRLGTTLRTQMVAALLLLVLAINWAYILSIRP